MSTINFTLDYHVDAHGILTIEDLSKKFDQYLPEVVNRRKYPDQADKFKESESKLIEVIYKVDQHGKSKLIDAVISDHSDDDRDIINYQINTDGYYQIYHIALPTVEWWKNNMIETITEYEDPDDIDSPSFTYDRIKDIADKYQAGIDADGNKIYNIYAIADNKGQYVVVKSIDGLEFKVVDVEELVLRNTANTTFSKVVMDVFSTSQLQCCYYSHARKVFDSMLNQCDKDCCKDDVYNRDFVYMTLNIINYLVGFGQYLEAMRILDMINSCGGFCKNKNTIKTGGGCGCAKS